MSGCPPFGMRRPSRAAVPDALNIQPGGAALPQGSFRPQTTGRTAICCIQRRTKRPKIKCCVQHSASDARHRAKGLGAGGACRRAQGPEPAGPPSFSPWKRPPPEQPNAHIPTEKNKKKGPRGNPPGPLFEQCSSIIVVDFSFPTEPADTAVSIIALFPHLHACRIRYRAVALLAVQLPIGPHVHGG